MKLRKAANEPNNKDEASEYESTVADTNDAYVDSISGTVSDTVCDAISDTLSIASGSSSECIKEHDFSNSIYSIDDNITDKRGFSQVVV